MQKTSLFSADEKMIVYVSTYSPRECGIPNFRCMQTRLGNAGSGTGFCLHKLDNCLLED